MQYKKSSFREVPTYTPEHKNCLFLTDILVLMPLAHTDIANLLINIKNKTKRGIFYLKMAVTGLKKDILMSFASHISIGNAKEALQL